MQRSVLIERTAEYGWDYQAIRQYVLAADPRLLFFFATFNLSCRTGKSNQLGDVPTPHAVRTARHQLRLDRCGMRGLTSTFMYLVRSVQHAVHRRHGTHVTTFV